MWYIKKKDAIVAVDHLAVLTVQTVFAFKGKYKAKLFSTDMSTSKDEE